MRLLKGCAPGDTVIGVSRKRPQQLNLADGVGVEWIEADLSSPREAVQLIARQAPDALDVLICNLGVWEQAAFSEHYRFLEDDDDEIAAMVNINITSTILALKHLVPRLLSSKKPQVIITGSTSGLRQSGRPEVTFGASKFALTGIGDALRESFRQQRLVVTCLQLGYLNTDDDLAVPQGLAAERGGGELVPVHDVVQVVRCLLNLSNASYVRELVLPAIADERF